MSSTYTANLTLRKLSHRDPDTVESWDAVINDNMDRIDQQMGSKTHAYQRYIANADTHTQSIDKIDNALYSVSLNTPTAAEKAALAGEGTPSVANKYTTKSYVDALVSFSRKLVLHPEFAAGTFTEGAGVDHAGVFVTDVDTTVTNFVYTYYKWLGTAGTLNQYDIVCKFRIPESFTSLATLKAVVVDICTEEIATTNNKVDVTIGLDGSATTASKTALTSAIAATWTSERESSSVAYFDAADLAALPIAAQSTLNVRITMYSNNKYVKIGAITFQYTG